MSYLTVTQKKRWSFITVITSDIAIFQVCFKYLLLFYFRYVSSQYFSNFPSWIVESHHHFIKLISWSEVLKSEISAGWFYARASRDESHFWAKPFLKSILNYFEAPKETCSNYWLKSIELFMTWFHQYHFNNPLFKFFYYHSIEFLQF